MSALQVAQSVAVRHMQLQPVEVCLPLYEVLTSECVRLRSEG